MKTTLMKAMRSEARVIVIFLVEEIPGSMLREGMKLKFSEKGDPEVVSDVFYSVKSGEAEAFVLGTDVFDTALDDAVTIYEAKGWKKMSEQGLKGRPIVGG